jgi:hypothetical protein
LIPVLALRRARDVLHDQGARPAMSQPVTHDDAPRDAGLERDALTAEDDVLLADDHCVLFYDRA